jgi:hypothetical protein
MLQGRSLPSLVAMYLVVIGTLLACAGIGLAVVVKTAVGLSKSAAGENLP